MNECECRLRVRYAETDQMGVAYHANYFVWFEVGRTEFCRQAGFSYKEMESRTQSFLVVADASCRYRRPLRYDQEFTVRTRIKHLRRRTIVFGYELRDAQSGDTLALGETKHIVVNREGRPKSFPEPYRSLLEKIAETLV